MKSSEAVLVDTGALIALFNPNDPHHGSCADVAKHLPVGKAYTCWPVVTETSYLLCKYPVQRDEFLAAVEHGEFTLLQLTAYDIQGIRAIVAKYDDQEIDLADAAIIHLANREDVRTVFTLDRRHFGILRRSDGASLELLPK